MSDRDAFARLLARHYGIEEAPPSSDRPRGRWLDDRSRAALLDASLEVLAAVRTLTKVAEEVLRDRRGRLLDHPEAPGTGDRPTDLPTTRERIPLSY